MEQHPSEAELQQFALDEGSTVKEVSQHIRNCPECEVQVASYRMAFTGVGSQERPVFDFDVSELVLAQIEPSKNRSYEGLFSAAVVLVIMSLCGALWYWTGWSFSELFQGLSKLVMYLVVFVSVIFLFFQSMDLYKSYRRKMRVLDVI